MRATLDHIAIAAETLEEGVAWAEERLGVSLTAGGQHPLMGTHNRLLGMGDLYLEVITIDPNAPAPGRARWFDLDRFAGPPRLNTWIARCDDLGGVPEGAGVPIALSRGDLRWQMAVPEDGILPFDGCFPALISWEGTAHPTQVLPDSGCRLTRLEVIHPDATTLKAQLGDIDLVDITSGAQPRLRAHIDTPGGVVVLE